MENHENFLVQKELKMNPDLIFLEQKSPGILTKNLRRPREAKGYRTIKSLLCVIVQGTFG